MCIKLHCTQSLETVFLKEFSAWVKSVKIGTNTILLKVITLLFSLNEADCSCILRVHFRVGYYFKQKNVRKSCFYCSMFFIKQMIGKKEGEWTILVHFSPNIILLKLEWFSRNNDTFFSVTWWLGILFWLSIIGDEDPCEIWKMTIRHCFISQAKCLIGSSEGWMSGKKISGH